MSRPTVVYTRPAAWEEFESFRENESEKLELIFADIFGETPTLRKGHPAGDSVGGKVTEEGLERLVETFKQVKPDVFFHWSMYGVWNEEAYKRLKEASPKTLFVFGQGNQVLYKKKIDIWLWDYAKYIDVVLTNTTDPARHAILKKYVERTGVFYTFGFTPYMHGEPNVEPTFDCFFGGGDSVRDRTHTGKFPRSKIRHNLIMKVNANFKLLLRGGGTWNKWKLPVKPGLHALEYFREMQKAKIVLGTYHFDLERYYTKRTIYGLASGRMLLTRYIPRMEKDGFVNHINVVWFHTVRQAIDLIKHYLKHPVHRERIAKKGRELAIEKHSWETRFYEFEKIVEGLLK